MVTLHSKPRKSETILYSYGFETHFDSPLKKHTLRKSVREPKYISYCYQLIINLSFNHNTFLLGQSKHEHHDRYHYYP
jgi:hypothetical protein